MIERGMRTVKLERKQWRRIKKFIERHPNVYVGNNRDCKRFVEGVLWLMRSGSQWRLLPEKYGNWNSVYKRFNRWSERGIWEAMFKHFANDPNMQSLMIDGSVVRAHACAAGAAYCHNDGCAISDDIVHVVHYLSHVVTDAQYHVGAYVRGCCSIRRKAYSQLCLTTSKYSRISLPSKVRSPPESRVPTCRCHSKLLSLLLQLHL